MNKKIILKLAVIVLANGIITLQNITAQSYSLYGVTQYGGRYNDGVIYKYSYPSGNDTVIFNFNDTSGAVPLANLIQASDGNLYGTASEGGTSNDGVFYCINPITYKDTVLINFHGANGANPHNALFQANNGLLYGLTFKGGTHDKGVCYSYDITTKTQTILFSFDGTNGSYPSGYFIQATNGFLIGRTKNGGLYGDGTLFYYNITTGNDSVLVNFNNTNGSSALGGLLQATNGLIYGTTLKGGASDYGVLYSYNLVSRTLTVLFDFTGPNGIYPSANRDALIQSSSSFLYGMTQMGGIYNNGIIYSYDINTGNENVLINFTSTDTLGKNPYTTGFVESSGDVLLTPIDSGGVYGLGTLLLFDTHIGRFTKLMDFNGSNGSYPTNNLLAIETKCSTIKVNPVIIFPNPSQGIVSISGQNFDGEAQVQIFNMLGDKVYQGRYIEKSYINLQNEPKGIYLFRIISSNGAELSTGKFILE